MILKSHVVTVICDVILAPISEIKGRNKKVKVRVKNKERQKTKSGFVSSDNNS